MTSVIFDAEPLLAFAFGEPGTETIEQWLDRVYDAEIDGFVTTVNLAEFRNVATRLSTPQAADAFIDDLQEIGVSSLEIDDLWREASALKADYSPALGDAYALAAAEALDSGAGDVTLLVGADDDYDVFEEVDDYAHLIDRFRTNPA